MSMGIAMTTAEGLRARIVAAADDNERLRALEPELVRAMKAAGAFRLLIPEQFGGKGAALPDFVEALMCFAEADASTAWCVSQGAVIGTTSMWLPAASARALWADPDCAIANGPPRGPRLEPDGESYRLTGSWGFSSGSAHATWMHGAVRRTSDGAWLGVYFPKADAAFRDNWETAGLRGTSSVEFSVEDLPLTPDWITDFRQPPVDPGTLFRIPIGLVFAVSFASVALGVARAGMDVVIDLAQDKVPGYGGSTVRDDPDMQRLVGEAEMCWSAARGYLRETVARIWAAVEQQTRITNDQRIALRMAGTHTIGEAARALGLAYTVAGSSAIYRDNPLQRRFQDMQVITQHVQGRPGHYGMVGRYFLGHEFRPGPLN